MATTHFVDGTTVIFADWLNDVDAHTFNQIADPHSQYALKSEFFPSGGPLPIAKGGTGGNTQVTALQALGALTSKTSSKTTGFTVVSADRGTAFLCSGTFTVSLTSAATLGMFSFAIINTGTGVLTIDPSGSQQIDGAATKVLLAGQSCIVICDGTKFLTLGLSGSGMGATGGGNDKVFYENETNITTNYTISAGKNAMSAGPITINSGVEVTVPDGSAWTVV